MTRAATQEEKWDRERDYRKHEPRPSDPPSQSQRYAVAALIGHCEAIAASGLLGEPTELSLRVLIANALVEFGMPSEREKADA